MSSLLFLMAGGFHIYFNWKPLKTYFVSKARDGLNLRKEMVVCLVVGISGCHKLNPETASAQLRA